MNDNVIFLPHLSDEVVSGVNSWDVDAYILALEGWRRGLTLKWHLDQTEKFKEMKTWSTERPGKLFSLSGWGRTHYFFRTRGDKVTNNAVDIASNKALTKEYLITNNINVPQGASFSEKHSNSDILKFVANIDFPLVVKPTDGSYGRGVITDIENEKQLINALKYVREVLGYKEIIVEKHVKGQDYRVYVIDGQVKGAIKRTPAKVEGDGVNTIAKLIETKNKRRNLNPRLKSCLITINKEMEKFLEDRNTTINDVPLTGEVIFLNNICNISAGGDSEDVLNSLPEHIKEFAVRALEAIPGLPHGAVDIIANNENEEKVVLEINPTPQIGSLLFPMTGEPRDIPSAIIDYYFPETSNVTNEKERLYFDFEKILEPLYTRSAFSSTVSAFPKGKLYGKRFIVSGDVQRIDYHRGLRKQAFEKKLSGFIKTLINGDIEVIVVGTSEERITEFKQEISTDLERASVESIKESIWTHPIKIGFEIFADKKMQKEQLKIQSKELEVLYRDLKIATRQLEVMKNRVFWKVTLPIRSMTTLLKKALKK